VPVLPVCLFEPLWVQFSALLPERPRFSPTHPLGCHRQGIFDLAEQRSQVGLGPAEHAAREQRLASQAIADHPQNLVTDVRLHAVERERQAVVA
jgi:hypothetical protein